MNGRGQNSECCLGRGIYNPRLFPLPDQDLCKPNARPTKCPTQQCKPKARLTKPPRLLGMRNDTTTACWASNENPEGFDTDTPEYERHMFDLLDQTVRVQPVSVLISGLAIAKMQDRKA